MCNSIQFFFIFLYYIILYNDPQESTMTVQQGKAHYHVEVLLRIEILISRAKNIIR